MSANVMCSSVKVLPLQIKDPSIRTQEELETAFAFFDVW
jgi:hypothetical protein